jgi:hypothetical protein
MLSDKPTVNTPSAAYVEMSPRWELVCALLGGTEAMRAAAKAYLPQYERESDEAYKNRLNRTFLLNYFGKTVKTLGKRPFSEPVQVGDKFPKELGELIDDVDGLGKDLTAFLCTAFTDALGKGLTHILVDYPTVGDEVKTLADEQRLGLKPYFVHVPAENLIAAFAEVENGKEQLTHIRVRECESLRDGWGEKQVQRVRVWERDHWELWQEASNNQFEKVAEGPNKLGFIPLVTYYAGEREGLMKCRPPLMDLAYKNVEHWQSSSDQRNVLSVARFPILTVTGLDGDALNQVVVGPKRILHAKDPMAKFGYLEHNGSAIDAGRQDLEDLKDEMAMLGIELLVRRQGGTAPTATEKAINTEQSTSELQSLASGLADAAELAFSYAAKWKQLDATDDALRVQVNTDIGVDQSTVQDLDVLYKARAAREISRAAFLAELKRRGVLMADFDEAKDAESLSAEGPSLASLRLPQPPAPGATQPPAPAPKA